MPKFLSPPDINYALGILASYAASKGAVISLTRQIAVDLAKYQIHCNAICPGFVETAIFKNTIKNWTGKSEEESKAALDAQHPFRGVGRVEDIANGELRLDYHLRPWWSLRQGCGIQF